MARQTNKARTARSPGASGVRCPRRAGSPWPIRSFLSRSPIASPIPTSSRRAHVTIRVESVPDHGMATIWDADIPIWAKRGQIVGGQTRRWIRTSRLIGRHYLRNHRASSRSRRQPAIISASGPRSTGFSPRPVCTSIRQKPAEGSSSPLLLDPRRWKERADAERPARTASRRSCPTGSTGPSSQDALVSSPSTAPTSVSTAPSNCTATASMHDETDVRQRHGASTLSHPAPEVRRAVPVPARFAFELRDIIRRQPLPRLSVTVLWRSEIGGRTAAFCSRA